MPPQFYAICGCQDLPGYPELWGGRRKKEEMEMRLGASTFIWLPPFSNRTLDLLCKVRTMGFDLVEIRIEEPATIDPTAIR
jgi:hypothetical protein